MNAVRGLNYLKMLDLGLGKKLFNNDYACQNYRLIRSKRKTLSLQIDLDAHLIVRAPQRLSVSKIEEFINSKKKWIESKTNILQKKSIAKPSYLTGEKFLYLGNSYPLILDVKHNNKLEFNGDYFKLNTSINGADEFHHWYKLAFKKIAVPRLEYYSNLYKLHYKNIRLKSQKTIWGSCSGINNINLNYLLICAPISVIDYVIVHELSHIKQKNHSKHFWSLVESILPNYRVDNKWLKDNGHRLHNL